jgi:hypothetical protein
LRGGRTDAKYLREQTTFHSNDAPAATATTLLPANSLSAAETAKGVHWPSAVSIGLIDKELGL